MNALLTKEWYLIKKNSFSVIVMILMFSLMGIIGNSTSILFCMLLYAGLLPVSYMTYDETSKWQQYSLTMPYDRNTIVSSKYIITLLTTLFAGIITATMQFVNMKLHNSFAVKDFLTSLVFFPWFGLLTPTIALPLNFKFGTVKGRTTIMLILGIIGGLLGVFLAEGTLQETVFRYLSGMDTSVIIAAVLGGFAVMYALSWLISIKIFQHKDL